MAKKTSELFSEKSDLYASARPRYPSALYDWIQSQCVMTDSVWDAACGNGQAAHDLALYFTQVQATDISPEQIRHAKETDRVSFSVQSSEQTSFANNQFDAICVAQALHWFRYDAFWPEVQRVLKPGGLFVAWGYCWPSVNEDIDAALQESLLSIIEPYWAAENRLLWNGYKEIALPFERMDGPELTLDMTCSLDQFMDYLHSWSATRQAMAHLGEDFFALCRSRLAELWQEGEVKTVSHDLVLVAARKPC